MGSRLTRNNHTITLPRKLNRLDSRIMSTPSSNRPSLFHVPEEYPPISPYAGEP